MRLIGTRFSTWRVRLGGADHVLKSMDFVPPGREPSLCFRDFLGYRLGSRLGLAVPATRLLRHPRWGRCSAQLWIAGARPPTAAEQRRLAPAAAGLRILLLDLLSRNGDRRADNLLVAGPAVFPIDFNVAFDFPDDGLSYEECRDQIMRWFGLAGVLGLGPGDRDRLLGEGRRLAGLLSDPYLNFALGLVDDPFLSGPDRARLLACLRRRRDALGPSLARWWDETVNPLHRLLGEPRANATTRERAFAGTGETA
jgi:hypothetical protein